MRRGIGAQMLAARRRAGLTQDEVARRMGTQRTSISRAEAGRTRASIDFLERFARALGAPMVVTFGSPTRPVEGERWERARLNFRFLVRRENAKFGDGIYPEDARLVGLSDGKPFEATNRYWFALSSTARSGEGPRPWMERDPKDLRWAAAIASIWYDEIDWVRVRERLADDPKIWRADIKVRFRARRVVAARGP
jgi:transcriptional regulator with XRE-family HTH domain